MIGNDPEQIESLKRRIRLVVLLDAAEQAGLVPIKILRLHAFAYLSNVLSPVWDMPALDGKVLKRQGGPFYPGLQADLDRLVAMGVAVISSLGHVQDEERKWRLEGEYRLNRPLAEPILTLLNDYDDERRVVQFIRELALALSALSDDELDSMVMEDATYSDPVVGYGSVVDFGEWRSANYSANAARYFDHVIPGGSSATPGEKLHLYARHLGRRIRARG